MRAVAVGNFDGVHRGHAHLINLLKVEAASRGLAPAVITFPRHPLALISPNSVPASLSSPDLRRALLEQLDVEVLMLDFTPEFRAMTAEKFLAYISERFQVKMMLMGFNNHIGSDRLNALDPNLRAAAARARIEIVTASELDDEGVSSSAVRAALAAGNVEKSAHLLGRPYALEGRVVHGRQLGRTIGFPTANISPEQGVAIPSAGVYLCTVSGHRAVVNIGNRPTVDRRTDAPLSVEAHLLDFSGDLYDRKLTLEFHSRLRDEKRFESLDELKSAIARDVKMAYERKI